MTDICGVETTKGEPCQNPAESCPWHDVDEKPDVGRPTKCNSDLIDDFIDLIDSGYSIRMASDEVGVSRCTVYNWLNRGVSDDNTIYAELKRRFDSVWYDDYNHEEHCSKIMSDHYSTEDAHWVWKGGRRNYRGPNWSTQREKALKRSMYCCESCGMTGENHQDKYGYDLHVHHIVSRKNFLPDDPEQNSLDNLCVLCHRCHELYEDTNISPVERVDT